MTWIKMETSLRTHPKVVTLASRLTVTRVTVLGGLCHAWMIADEHADENGLIPFLDLEGFDSLVELPGIAKAMLDVGWLTVSDAGIEFPNYLEHNGSTAKERAQAQRRQGKSRSKKAASRSTVTDVTPDRDASVTRGEERREEKSKKREEVILPFLSDEFSEAWKTWEQHRREIRKPLKPTSTAQQLKRLRMLTEKAAIEMIEWTIFKGWEGLREPDEIKPEKPQTRERIYHNLGSPAPTT
jgi:hypothetical protein